MIVGTAGHIDHGKTTLVRTLTGVDTDRLAEEKARGISIDLGYAYLPLGAGGGADAMLGFVDVPGHERFVHTMVAGASGIDFALLVVAADDGVIHQHVIGIPSRLCIERGPRVGETARGDEVGQPETTERREGGAVGQHVEVATEEETFTVMMHATDKGDERLGLRLTARRVALAVEFAQAMELRDRDRAVRLVIVEADDVGVSGARVGAETVRGERAMHEIQRLADDGDVLPDEGGEAEFLMAGAVAIHQFAARGRREKSVVTG